MGQKSNTIQKENTEPWAGQQPYLLGAFDEAAQRYRDPNSTIAPFDPAQTEAQNYALSYGRTAAPQLVANTMGAHNFALNAPDVNQNPYLPQLVQGAVDPISSRLMQEWLPSIRSSGQGAGGIGGSRQGIAEGAALSGATRSAMQTAGDIYSRAYDSGLEAQGRAIGLAPQVAQLGLLPSEVIGNVGNQRQAMLQALLNEPDQRLAQLMSVIGGGGYGGQSTKTGPGSSPVQGALGGAGLGYSLGSSTSLGGGWGALLGALAGYAAS